MKEVWVDILGYEYKYKISNYGRVKIKENVSQRMNMGMLRDYVQKSKIMKPTRNGYGYLKVRLTDENGKAKNLYIHRLVAEHFIPNPENKQQVNHKDGNKTNNHVDNLEWATSSENITHAIDVLDFKPNTKGINAPSPVLQIDKETNKVVGRYDTITEAQKITGISHISCVCRGQRKTAGGYIWKYQ